MDRCALFVDAGYLLADGAMAVHGTRHREAVSWDYPGLLRFLTTLSRERTGLPLLRCYWYEATVEGRRTPEHDVLADIPGLKLRLGRIRPGRREGVDAQVHRDLMTLARNNAVCDAVVVSGDEDLTQVVSDAQDLGIRVTVMQIAGDGAWSASRTLRQECDDLVELVAGHLRPYVTMLTGAEPGPGLGNGQHPASSGNGQSHGNGLVPHANGSHINGSQSNGAQSNGTQPPSVLGGSSGADALGPGTLGSGTLGSGAHGTDAPGTGAHAGGSGSGSRGGTSSGTVSHGMQSHGLGPHGAAPHEAGSHEVGPHEVGPRGVGSGATGSHSTPSPGSPSALTPGTTAPGGAPHLAHDSGSLGAEALGAGAYGTGSHGPAGLDAGGHSAGHSAGHGAASQSMGTHGTGTHGPTGLDAGGHDAGHSAASQSTSAHGTGSHGTGSHGTGSHGTGTHGPAGLDAAAHGTGSHGTSSHGTSSHGTGSLGTGSLGTGSLGTGAHSAGAHGGGRSSAAHARPALPAQPSPPVYNGYAPDTPASQQRPTQASSPAPLSAPPPSTPPAPPTAPIQSQYGSGPSGYSPSQLGPYTGPQPAPVPVQTGGTTTLAEAVKAAHKEGHDFGESVARDAPALWLEAVLARKPRMPSDLEARLLQGSSLPIDFLLHDEVRHALRRGFWDALERARR